ncbi:hypothetical protein AJ78_08984 [Emergomyces pasteurianus Ep9510]|uniref:Uncharacterized protein n=1 Tax=Emergomyces pasteurianus Ep9510 TaxID=1447872 RepID=A0A1J9NYI4_9EURO|nr:hypothetical protein AJ78_08984 [Emergomyces pasteurianus Ep9510]
MSYHRQLATILSVLLITPLTLRQVLLTCHKSMTAVTTR